MNTASLIIGIMIAFALMALVGILAVKRIKNSSDFTVAGKQASQVMVAGTILGSIVGAGGTVGTAETAFKLGIVGWWQTLGLGIGCIVLSLGLSQVIYKVKTAETIPQLIKSTFGEKIVPITAIFSSIAIFLSILSQMKGFLPLLTSVIPISLAAAATVGVLLVLVFVVFGGIFATSLGGLLKMFLILAALVVSSVIAVFGMGGFGNMFTLFEPSYFNLFARGFYNDAAIGLKLVLGVLVTQTYVQAVLSAKDAKAARNGAMLGAILTIPIGLFGVAVGLFMKANFPDMVAAQALPQFMINTFPPVVAGLFIGALMLASLGSNAGLTLGVATLLSRDVYTKIKPNTTEKEKLFVLRMLMIVIVGLTGVFAVTEAGKLIQTFVFLSFGLRVCVFFVPMMFAFFYKKPMSSQAGMAAVLVGPIVNIYWNMFPPFKLDAIYPGLIAAFIAFVLVNSLTAKKIEREVINEHIS